jgi:hypothetical protein
MNRDLLRDAVRSALLQRAGLRASSQTMASATAAFCRVLVVQLAPVIGASGLEVLFKRVLHNSSAAFPFLVMVATDSPDENSSTVARLSACLAAQPVATATEASTEFFAGFAELLTIFIGAPLTERLLAPLWGLPPPASNGRLLDDR